MPGNILLLNGASSGATTASNHTTLGVDNNGRFYQTDINGLILYQSVRQILPFSNSSGNTNLTFGANANDLSGNVTLSGSAGTRTMALDVTGRIVNDKLTVIFKIPATAGIVIECRNATAGGTLLNTITSDSSGNDASASFIFDGTAWQFQTGQYPSVTTQSLNVSDLATSTQIYQGTAKRVVDALHLKEVADWISVVSFGADITGVDDSTVAITAAFVFAISMRVPVYFPAGIYKLGSTVEINSHSGFMPEVFTDGAQSVFINYQTIASGSAAFAISGGAGSTRLVEWKGMTLTGNSNSTGFWIDSRCRFQIRGVCFDDNLIGIHLCNKYANSFNEYIRGIDCTFNNPCLQVMMMTVEAGEDSFHGCGLENYEINVPVGSTYNQIIIGAGAVWYNGIMSGQLWKGNNTSFIRNDSSYSKQTFHMDMTTEGQPGYVLCSGVSPVYCTGSFISYGGHSNVEFFEGSFWCDAIIANPDASVTPVGWRRVKRQNLVSGENAFPSLTLVDGMGGPVDLTIYGPNYYYHYTLLVSSTPYADQPPTVTITRLHNSFDTGGVGAPVIGYDSVTKQFVISNASYSSSFYAQIIFKDAAGRTNYLIA